jgi:hypothetical protein
MRTYSQQNRVKLIHMGGRGHAGEVGREQHVMDVLGGVGRGEGLSASGGC